MSVDRPHKPVLIVGAGPTGLSLALWLRKMGVPYDLIDRRAQPSTASKALSINPASIAQFALLGQGLSLGSEALPVHKLNVHWENRLRLTSIDLRRLSEPEPWAFLIQKQEHTERDLIDALARLGGDVERGIALQNAQEEGEQVVVVLRDEQGRNFTRTYDFVVGCDGKHSVVREAMGATFQEERFGAHLVLGDIALNWEGASDEVYYHVFEDTFFVLVPLGQGVWRVVVKGNGDQPSGAIGAQDLLGPLNKHLPQVLVEGEPTWLSYAPLYCAVASHLRKGRMFIAGDAAHLYPPLGGTGMNTGMQDAINLAWKLALVLDPCAVPSQDSASRQTLLDSYERERLPAIQANAAATTHVTRVIARQARLPQQIAPFMPVMGNRTAMRTALPWQNTGFAIRYDARTTALPGKPSLGALFPPLFKALGGLNDFASPSGPAYLLVMLDRMNTGMPAIGSRALNLCHARRLRVLRLVEHRAPSQMATQNSEDSHATCRALSSRDWTALAAHDRHTFVLRPDGILGFVAHQATQADIEGHLAKLPI